MAVKLRIKSIADYIEVSPEVNGVKQKVIFGIKTYGAKEQQEIKRRYIDLFSNNELELTNARLQEFLGDEVNPGLGDRTSPDYYTQRNEYLDKITSLSEQKDLEKEEFFREQILFIKNASLQEEDEDGKVTDLSIPDTRSVKPIDSLWKDEKECLVVLLDIYLDNPSIRESLIESIVGNILGSLVKERIKNSK